MNVHELLVTPVAYMAPASALDGLTPEVADRRVEGTHHSIAELVAHMTFWQNWFINRCQSIAVPPPDAAAKGWPQTQAGSWPAVLHDFLDGLDRAVAIGSDAAQLDQPITPAIEFPPLAHYTRRDALVHMATHNSHHLGQIILLRQMLGSWPPPSGSYTW